MIKGNLQSSFCPVSSIQIAIANGFCDVVALNFLAGFEVGNGAGYFQDAVVSTSRKAEAFHSHAEHVEGLGIGLGKLMNHLFRHLSIAMDTASPPALSRREGAEAFLLDFASGNDTGTNRI